MKLLIIPALLFAIACHSKETPHWEPVPGKPGTYDFVGTNFWPKCACDTIPSKKEGYYFFGNSRTHIVIVWKPNHDIECWYTSTPWPPIQKP